MTLQRTLYTHVQCSSVHNRWDMESAPISNSGGKTKENVKFDTMLKTGKILSFAGNWLKLEIRLRKIRLHVSSHVESEKY